MISQASGLSPWAAQVLGGLPGVNWTDILQRLMGMGQPDNTLGNLMVPQGGIPQLGPINPKPRIPVSPARAPLPPAATAPMIPLPLSFMGTNGQQAGGYAPPGSGYAGNYGASPGWSPGMDANGWSGMFGLGFGGMDGSSGFGGLLGLGDVGAVGHDAGPGGNDLGSGGGKL